MQNNPTTITGQINQKAIELLEKHPEGIRWSEMLRLIQEAYPDAPILDWIKQARLWAIANPIKQKTARGMPSFLIGWVTRQNDRPAQPRTYQTNGKSKPANLQEVLAKMPAGFVMPGEQKL